MNAPQLRKYTDRDVRENSDLMDLAMDWLRNYEGEFPFLIDCKMRQTMGHAFTPGMVRGVLNCMLVDPRAPEMPAPLNPDDMGQVIPMQPRKKKGKKPKRIERVPCPLLERGIFHRHKIMDSAWHAKYEYCSGLYRINRSTVHTPARFNGEVFAVGKSPGTVLVHRVQDENSHFSWQVPAHEYGWYKHAGSPHLNVKLACKIPSWLTDPILLRAEHIFDFNQNPDEWYEKYGFYRSVRRERAKLQWCPRCFLVEDSNA